MERRFSYLPTGEIRRNEKRRRPKITGYSSRETSARWLHNSDLVKSLAAVKSVRNIEWLERQVA
jgi:hypothetical protein